jgi:hypothetical protein
MKGNGRCKPRDERCCGISVCDVFEQNGKYYRKTTDTLIIFMHPCIPDVISLEEGCACLAVCAQLLSSLCECEQADVSSIVGKVVLQVGQVYRSLSLNIYG